MDAGSSCPNRDGTLSSKGCLFCNSHGSGSGLEAQGVDLSGQWNYWAARYAKRFKNVGFIAYLQSFTNTYGPLERLKKILNELKELNNLVGLAVGTRPDCLDHDKLRCIADFPAQELWLELGLQSADDAVLRRINRGHDVESFISATRQAAALGLKVCAHVIAGLPGDSCSGFERTIELCSRLPVSGVKIHNTYVCKGSGLAALWRQGQYTPLEKDQYMEWLLRGLPLLRPDIVVQRITGDPAPGELLAPEWAASKGTLLQQIEDELHTARLWQGCAWRGPLENRIAPWPRRQAPEWFAPDAPPPPRLFE